MTNQIKRKELIDLFKKAQFTDSEYSQGRITVDSHDLVQSLKLAFDDNENTGWHRTTTLPIEINQTYNFQYNGVVPGKLGYVFRNIDDLCSHNITRGTRGKKYYIIELKFDKDDLNKPDLIQNYEILLSFIKLLKESASFSDSSSSKMLFLNDKDSLELDPKYAGEDLDKLKTSAIDSIIQFITDNTHKVQKLAILSKAIITECKNESFDRRFAVLLSRLDSVSKTLEHDYALFASSFSYEKLRNEIENAKLEEQVKIHKVITDIQNQILGIPIATVVVATQFKTQKSVMYEYTYQFAINTGISLGVFIFTVILWYLIKNQKESLEAINIELSRKDKKFKIDSFIVYQQIIASSNEPPFEKLFNRIKTQKDILNSINIICIIACFITLIIYAYITVNPFGT